MARPTPFDRQTSFAQFSAQFPAKPQNGASIDAEFNAVKVALDETQSNLNSLQDDDGALARGSVGRAQLDASITLGFGAPSAWAADTTYDANASTVFHSGIFYIATETHTSTDTFDATKWEEIADFSTSNSIDDGSITDDKLAANAVTAEKIAALAVTESKIATGAVSTAKVPDKAITFAKLADAVAAQLRDSIIPAGLGPIPWSSNTAPAGWVFDGGTYLRSDYPALSAFALAEAAAGNTWFTVGDGSTTFTIKDAEGLTPVAVDVDGSVVGAALALGATVGSKNKTIAQANLPDVIFAVAIPAGQGSHAHSSNANSNNTTSTTGGGSFTAVGNATATISPATLPAMVGTAASGGSGTALDIVQPSVGVRFIFKAH